MALDYNTRSNLIADLAGSFNSTGNPDLRVDSSNFVSETNSIDATAMGLSIEDLQKTINVIDDHITRFSNVTDPLKSQLTAHLRIAKKCVEEIIVQKRRKG